MIPTELQESRQFNYLAAHAIERLALTPKAPWFNASPEMVAARLRNPLLEGG